MSLEMRLLFWIFDVLGVMAIMLSIAYLVHRLWALQNLAVLSLLSAALGSVPASYYLHWLFPYFADGRPLENSTWLLALELTFSATTLLAIQFIAVPYFAEALRPEPKVAPRKADNSASARLPLDESLAPIYEQLPAELRGAEIVSISMEDHYAKITTTAGEHLRLMRLSDAIVELGDIPGAQVHRSHWVAAAFAEAIERSGRKHEVVLRGHGRLPVSNTYLDAAKALVDMAK